MLSHRLTRSGLEALSSHYCHYYVPGAWPDVDRFWREIEFARCCWSTLNSSSTFDERSSVSRCFPSLVTNLKLISRRQARRLNRRTKPSIHPPEQRLKQFQGPIVWRCFRDPMISCFGTEPACNGQTHDDSIYRASIASRGKKGAKRSGNEWKGVKCREKDWG